MGEGPTEPPASAWTQKAWWWSGSAATKKDQGPGLFSVPDPGAEERVPEESTVDFLNPELISYRK